MTIDDANFILAENPATHTTTADIHYPDMNSGNGPWFGADGTMGAGNPNFYMRSKDFAYWQSQGTAYVQARILGVEQHASSRKGS
jgi:hypothetical protein